jgi:hypothetical protein
MNFDRVCVISLARRPDRLEAFRARCPIGGVEVVEAVDGKVAKHPAWWKQGGGAWGCYRSHLKIIEESLHRGHERVLIFEDDATFCDDFVAKTDAFIESLPEGWKQAYLGGQHLKPPVPVPGVEGVVAVKNVNRTHAYAINGREGLLALYRHLFDTSDWRPRHHIDHHYGRLHASAKSGFYAPSQWLCGQAGGRSDVSWKDLDDRWWMPPSQRPLQGTFVAVVGLHRSGSSATAMMLHKLGVSMGDKLVGYESVHGGGGEAAGLANICEWAAKFPSPEITAPRGELRDKLSAWIRRRLRGRSIAGGKYPHLCAMGDELMSICGDRLRVIVCDRSLEDSIDSLKRRSAKSRGWLAVTDEQSEVVQKWLWGERERFLAAIPDPTTIHRISYERLTECPEEVIDGVVAFLGIEPAPEQRAAAAAHIIRKEPVS